MKEGFQSHGWALFFSHITGKRGHRFTISETKNNAYTTDPPKNIVEIKQGVVNVVEYIICKDDRE